MDPILLDGAITPDSWVLLATCEPRDVQSGDIVPLVAWPGVREHLPVDARIGIWLAPEQQIEEVASELSRFAVIALQFPAFNDGRHYSTAHLLRSRYRYSGEIRAFGDVRRDEIEQMHRCGFNSFVPRDGETAEHLLAGLRFFSHTYQTSADRPLPLFRLRSSN